jgi:hypothetical protein
MAPGGWRGLGAVLLALDGLVAAAFFASRWAIDAEGFGRRDLGLALALAFAVPLLFYLSLALAAVGAALTGLALARRRPAAALAAGVAVALLPLACLWLLDLRAGAVSP